MGEVGLVLWPRIGPAGILCCMDSRLCGTGVPLDQGHAVAGGDDVGLGGCIEG